MQTEIFWTAESRFGTLLYDWWRKLDEDRGGRAMLRRCASLDEVALCPAYQRFYRTMLACHWPAQPWRNDRLAAIVGLLAHVKDDDGQRLPEAMSALNGDKPLVSELRFRSVLKVDELDDLFTQLRRILPLVGHRAGIYRLAHDVYWWNDEIRKQWAYSYRWPSA